MPKFIDIAGHRFGRLVAVAVHSRGRQTRWLCQCDCGNYKVIGKVPLQTGDTKSCGCLQSQNRLKHGYAGRRSRSNVYDVWNQMIQRCENKKNKWYKCYGARGISVCARWHKFENFMVDMGPRPDGYSIERVDNDGNYEPKNCVWIPFNEQQKNQRRPHRPKAARVTTGITTPAQ